jgi:hypothetical protein
VREVRFDVVSDANLEGVSEPSDRVGAELLYQLARFYAQRRNMTECAHYLEKLATLSPDLRRQAERDPLLEGIESASTGTAPNAA